MGVLGPLRDPLGPLAPLGPSGSGSGRLIQIREQFSGFSTPKRPLLDPETHLDGSGATFCSGLVVSDPGLVVSDPGLVVSDLKMWRQERSVCGDKSDQSVATRAISLGRQERSVWGDKSDQSWVTRAISLG